MSDICPDSYRGCKNFKSSYTPVYCGLKFLRALISNILKQTLDSIDRL